MSTASSRFITFSTELKDSGSALLPPHLVFSAEEIDRLVMRSSRCSQRKRVSVGDASDTHDLYVRRIMIDKPGKFPKRVNQPLSDRIMDVLADYKRKAIFEEIFQTDTEYFIRRCQINRMVKNSFIGGHIDLESNPDYEFSVIIQLSRAFQGGEFVVYPDEGTEQIYRPTHGTVLVTTCRFRHEVRKVLENERSSLVYFYSKNNGVNRRQLS
jgi:hypothetical protein